MGEPEFVAQAKLEEWIDKGEVTFENGVLTLLASGQTHALRPAVRVHGLIDGQDTQRLLGRVFTVAQLQERALEHFSNTIIAGDTGYECEEGYVGMERAAAAPGVAMPAAAAPAASSAASAPAPGPAAATSRPVSAAPPPPVMHAPLPPAPWFATPAAPAPLPAVMTAREPAFPTPPAPAAPAQSSEQEKTDSELLADFLLKNL